MKYLILLVLTSCTTVELTQGLSGMCGTEPDAAVDAVPDAPPPPSINLATAWPRHTIYNGAYVGHMKGADGVHMVDVNGDGLLDLTSGWEQSAKTTVSYHPGCSAASNMWPTTILPGTTSGVEDAVFGDVDGDGRMDVVSSGSSVLRLYVHFANSNGTWTYVSINAAANTQRFLKAIVVDIDGDGFNDIVTGGYSTGASLDVYSSRTPRDPASWTRRIIGQVATLYSLQSRDVDGDEDIDLVLTDRDRITGRPDLLGSRWLENQGMTFVNHQIGVGVAGTRWLHVSSDTKTVVDGAWIGTAPTTNTFTLRTSVDRVGWVSSPLPFPTNVGQYSAAVLQDIDQDGIDDMVMTFSHAVDGLSGVAWLKGPTWERGEVSGPEGEKYDNMQLYDVDCDGDRDIVVNEQGRKGDVSVVPLGNIWYENTLGTE